MSKFTNDGLTRLTRGCTQEPCCRRETARCHCTFRSIWSVRAVVFYTFSIIIIIILFQWNSWPKRNHTIEV